MQVDGQDQSLKIITNVASMMDDLISIRVSKHNRNIFNIIRINILCVKSDKNGTSASHNS